MQCSFLSCMSLLSCGMIFLQPEELLLILISCISALLETNSSSFYLSENVFISPFIFKHIFTGFRMEMFFFLFFYPFSTLKVILLIIFSLHCLWWEASFHSSCSLVYDVPFFSGCFWGFSLFVVFSSLIWCAYHGLFSQCVICVFLQWSLLFPGLWVCVYWLLVLSHRSPWLFASTNFSLCASNWMIPFDFRFTNPFFHYSICC